MSTYARKPMKWKPFNYSKWRLWLAAVLILGGIASCAEGIMR
jgi:hypothetical protein